MYNKIILMGRICNDLEAFCNKYGAEVPPKSHPNYDKIFWGGVAKAVLHLPDIPATAEKKARDILTEYGFSPEIGRGMHW